MITLQKINNNVVLAQDEHHREFIAMGRGIGFGPVRGQPLDPMAVDKRFYEVHQLSAKQMTRILSDATQEEIEATTAMVALVQSQIPQAGSERFFFSLLDHLTGVIQRVRQDLDVLSPIAYEVQRFYPEAYALAEDSLAIIEAHTGQTLPKGEATFLALHFVNAQLSMSASTHMSTITTLIQTLTDLIESVYGQSLESQSFFFQRFVTHVQYFLLRQLRGEKLTLQAVIAIDTLQQKFPQEVHCVNLMEAKLQELRGWTISDAEKMYIILHLATLMSRL